MFHMISNVLWNIPHDTLNPVEHCYGSEYYYVFLFYKEDGCVLVGGRFNMIIKKLMVLWGIIVGHTETIQLFLSNL